MTLMHRLRRDRRVLWAWLLALVLVSAQALGVAHALAHASTPSTNAATTTVAADSNADGAADAFGHGAGGAPCTLWAALLGAAALTANTAPQAVPASESSPAAWTAVTARTAQPCAAFEARGPPAPALTSLR